MCNRFWREEKRPRNVERPCTLKGSPHGGGMYCYHSWLYCTNKKIDLHETAGSTRMYEHDIIGHWRFSVWIINSKPTSLVAIFNFRSRVVPPLRAYIARHLARKSETVIFLNHRSGNMLELYPARVVSTVSRTPLFRSPTRLIPTPRNAS
jgi:hypothetical protein